MIADGSYTIVVVYRLDRKHIAEEAWDLTSAAAAFAILWPPRGPIAAERPKRVPPILRFLQRGTVPSSSEARTSVPISSCGITQRYL